MAPTIMTADEARKWLHSLGMKHVRLPKGNRVLYVDQPPSQSRSGFLWKVEPFGSVFSVAYHEPIVKHNFSDTSFRLNINLDTLPPKPFAELAALLREIADKVERVDEKGNIPGGGWICHFQTIFDARKNDVGRFAIKPTGER